MVKDVYKLTLQDECLEKKFPKDMWKSFDLLRALSKSRNQIRNQVQFGLVTNLYKWTFTMYSRPLVHEVDEDSAFVNSRYWDLYAEDGRKETLKKQIQFLIRYITMAYELDRSPINISHREEEMIEKLENMKLIKLTDYIPGEEDPDEILNGKPTPMHPKQTKERKLLDKELGTYEIDEIERITKILQMRKKRQIKALV